VQKVVFCGEIVVKCVVKRGELMVVFWKRKNVPLSSTIFLFFSTDDKAALSGRLFGFVNGG
jgi:hypothetical protein